jgi:superfamily II DNA/RNA helicase
VHKTIPFDYEDFPTFQGLKLPGHVWSKIKGFKKPTPIQISVVKYATANARGVPTDLILQATTHINRITMTTK